RPISPYRSTPVRTERNGSKRQPTNFECGAFKHSAHSRWLQRDLFSLAAFVRHRARPPNVGTIVGSGRRNANHTMTSMGMGGLAVRRARIKSGRDEQPTLTLPSHSHFSGAGRRPFPFFRSLASKGDGAPGGAGVLASPPCRNAVSRIISRSYGTF